MEHVSIVRMIKSMHLHVDLLVDFQDRGVASYSACIDHPHLIQGIHFISFCFVLFTFCGLKRGLLADNNSYVGCPNQTVPYLIRHGMGQCHVSQNIKFSKDDVSKLDSNSTAQLNAHHLRQCA